MNCTGAVEDPGRIEVGPKWPLMVRLGSMVLISMQLGDVIRAVR